MRELNDYLKGAPNSVLVMALLGVAFVAVLVALCGDPIFKAALLAWIILP